MKLIRNIFIAAPIALLFGGMIATVPVFADSCSVQAVGTTNNAGKSTSRIMLSDNNTVASVSLKVTGNCSETYSLASWEAPNATFNQANIAAQKLHASTTKTFTAPGTYTMSVPMLDCYYQIDLVKGSSPTAANGTPFYNPGPMAFAQGGAQSCVQPPAAKYTCDALTISAGDNRTVTVNNVGVTAQNGATFKNVVIDWGDKSTPVSTASAANQAHQYTVDGTDTVTATAHFDVNGKDVTAMSAGCTKTVSFTTPGTPTTPTPTPTPTTPAATVLPNTGAGNIIGLFVGVSVIGMLAHRFFIGRRSTI